MSREEKRKKIVPAKFQDKELSNTRSLKREKYIYNTYICSLMSKSREIIQIYFKISNYFKWVWLRVSVSIYLYIKTYKLCFAVYFYNSLMSIIGFPSS